MLKDVLSPALIQSMVAGLSVPDLIRTTETFKQSGQLASVEAAYAAWVASHPQDPLLYAVLFNYSVALTDSGKIVEAQQALEQAISLSPDFMPAYINLGRVLERQGKIGLAIIQWSAALARMAAVNPSAVSHKVTALNQSARALEAVSQDEPAETMLRESLELDRDQSEVVQHLVALRQRQCKWPIIEAGERFDAGVLVRGMSPLSAGAFTDDPLWQLALAAHYNQTDVGSPAAAMTAWPGAVRDGDAPLRVGYLSSDLREHAVGYLMTEVPGLHDRSRVEVFSYYCGVDSPDAMHAHFQAASDHFRVISHLDDAAAAKLMAADGIQILVDLNGYTRDARLKLVALRPAPVIVNWLGYPGTMASPYHHYLIADDWIVPPEHEAYFSEKVVRLPCYQPSNRFRTVADHKPSRAEAGLPEGAMVFCCFNGAHKIHRATFDRWLEILARVPESVLWLLGGDEGVSKRLGDYAAAKGIARERLVFAKKTANAAHLARYPLADLFLDTTPYGAHTTASDALWSGVPVLTVSGRSFASRVCGSLVRAAGLPELVCETTQDYVERAVAYGNDRASLAPLRERLAADKDSCTLFDMPGLVRSLEDLYLAMWRDHEAGCRPRPDLANLDVYLEVGSAFDHEGTEVQNIADYEGWWAGRLAARNALRPIPRDRRLCRDETAYW
jgi:predicted O-linked N-acetylglucosamine transferase (SPINDLY family)